MRRRSDINSVYKNSIINRVGISKESFMVTDKIVGITIPNKYYYIRNDHLLFSFSSFKKFFQ